MVLHIVHLLHILQVQDESSMSCLASHSCVKSSILNGLTDCRDVVTRRCHSTAHIYRVRTSARY